ncbi:MAG: UPF0182 family membrane protein [Galactobacter sp.]
MSTGPFPFPSGRPGPSESREDTGRRRVGPLIPAIVVVVLVVAAFIGFAHLWTDILWFDQLGYGSVFWTKNITRVVLFAIAFLVMGAAVWLQLHLAWRHRPVYAPSERGDDPLAKYEDQVQSFRKAAFILIPAVIAAFAAITFASGWQTVQLFLNGESFGEKDPQFGLDVGFFITVLPFLKMLVGFLSSVVLFSGIAGILAQYLFGGIRVQDKAGLRISRAAGWQIGVSVAVFVLVQAINFWLGRYSTMLKQDGRVPGALYTEVHAVIPTRTILAIAAVAVAVVFIIGAAMGKWKLPLITTAMLVVVAVVAGAVYPAIIQQFNVRPSEKTMEQKYIQRNIDMTRQAYGLDDVDVSSYDAQLQPKKNALSKDAATTTNIRLLDPSIVSPAFAQLQQFRSYYKFADTLPVDRYTVDGKTQDTVIAVREVDAPKDSWVNQHITYTHGFGVVTADGNKVTSSGDPEFSLSGIPSEGKLLNGEDYEPRIYFGQNSPEFSVVGGPKDWKARELDRPSSDGEKDDDNAADLRNTFAGDGGPKVGNLFNKLTYAIKFGSMNLLLSDAVNEKSQILYDRDPQKRVKEVAPYLQVDSTAYPAIVDGRVKWIVDGYTTTNDYPYSTSQTLGDAVRDTLTGDSAQTSDQFSDKVNYIRNSVKATVDAYDGKVELYAWDDKDPLLKAWRSVYPDTVQPLSKMSADLMSHVRYPEDMFKVQRELLGKYHVTDADDFYEENDAWQVPNDPTGGSGDSTTKQPPYYLSIKMPGADQEAFSLTSAFIPKQAGSNARNVMYGFMAADGDAGNTAGKKDDTYGKIRLLKLPTQPGVPGPGQAQQNFDSNGTVSTQLNLLRQGASTVKNGNLLTLPVGGGMLYVQPVYVQSTGATQYPTLRKVLVSYGNSVGFADTLPEALDQVFEGDSGAETSDGAGTTGGGDEGGNEGGEGTEQPESTDQQKLSTALTDANEAIKEGQEALGKSDFSAYDKAQKKLQKALEDATAADDAINGTTDDKKAEDPEAAESSDEPAKEND